MTNAQNIGDELVHLLRVYNCIRDSLKSTMDKGSKVNTDTLHVYKLRI